jgi:endonuclease/exonuclease/phosphatase family metal-dependent hydrolase
MCHKFLDTYTVDQLNGGPMLFHKKNSAGGAVRILGLTLLVVSLMLAWGLSPALANGNRSIKVMTQNMDAGTDLGFVFGIADPVVGAQLTFQEITTQSRIPERAQRLAAEIAAAKPDLISLQEVTIWAVGPLDNPQVLYDQLELLLAALAARGENYDAVNEQPLTQAAAPLKADLSQLLFFNDRNVILARSDVKHSGISITNPQQGYFTHLFVFGGFTELLGWMSVDVEVEGKQIRFFNTHLGSTSAFFPERAEIQVDQGGELIQVLDESPFPVIVAGDFNSDASGLGIGPDLTPTAGNIADAGYVEVWQALHIPPDYGLTWPRYLEDIFPIPDSQVLATPTERIDLIFEKDLRPVNIERTLRANPPLASDHTGVMATLKLDK